MMEPTEVEQEAYDAYQAFEEASHAFEIEDASRKRAQADLDKKEARCFVLHVKTGKALDRYKRAVRVLHETVNKEDSDD